MSIHHVHDHFLKSALKNSTVSREFFSKLLPDEIKRIVNLEHLRLSETSFVDEELRSSSCDLLFETKFQQQPGYLYLLVEGQSTVDHYMPLRLWRYMLDIMYQHSTPRRTLTDCVPADILCQ